MYLGFPVIWALASIKRLAMAPYKTHPCDEHDNWQLACQVWEIQKTGHACDKCLEGCTFYCRYCGFTWLVPDLESLLRIQTKTP